MEIEHNDARTAGQDKIFYSLAALERFKSARFQISMKEYERQEVNHIGVPENQRDIYVCIHSARILHLRSSESYPKNFGPLQ